MTTHRTTYLTGVVKAAAHRPTAEKTLTYAHRADLGVLITPDTKSYRKYIGEFGGTWAADNACFSQADPWVETEDMTSRKERAWVRFLDQMIPWADTCLWATVPDVVGDHDATLARWSKYVGYATSRGYRPAFVVQNGATIAEVPWDEAGAIFIGGTTECITCGYTRPAAEYQIKRCPECDAKLTEWKESEAARVLVVEAQRRGLPVHMGRTNGADRMRLCRGWGIDTADGTYLLSGDHGKVMEWLDEGLAPEPTPIAPTFVQERLPFAA